MSGPAYPPDYCDKETLAYRLSVKPGAVDQLVKRGIIPPPTFVGDAMRWRWVTVEAAIEGARRGMDSARPSGNDDGDDPLLAGARRAAQAANARQGHPQT